MRKLISLAGGVALALTLAACSDDTTEDLPETAVEETSPEDADSAEASDASSEKATSETSEETETDDAASGDVATEDDGSEVALVVSSDNSGGPTIVTAETDAISADGTEYSGKFTPAAGDCWGMTVDDSSYLLIFPEGTTAKGGIPPGVTANLEAGEETLTVGDEVTLSAVEVPLDNLEGLPEACNEDAQAVLAVR